jgi:carbamoylphosphate synthase large subunit
MSSNSLDTPPPDTQDNNFGLLFKKYLTEVFEALICVLIVHLVSQYQINFPNIVKISFIVGTITFFIEYYDSEFKNTIKRGMTMSVGGSIIPK